MDYTIKTYKVRETRGAKELNKDSTGDFSRDQARRLKKQEHEMKLHEIIRLHKLWRELSAKLSQTDSTLSALSESIEQEKSREKDLLSKNTKLKGILSELQAREDLSRQIIYLRTLNDSSISSIIGRITNDRSQISKIEGKIVNLKNSYQLWHKTDSEYIMSSKSKTAALLKKLQIEVKEENIDEYLSKFEITIESVEEFIKIFYEIQKYEYIISSGKAAEDGDKKRDQAWKELESTTFYRERVAPLAEKFSAENQIGALTQVIQLVPDPEFKTHNRLKELQDIFDSNLRKLYPDSKETIASGYSAARNLYQALLDQDTQALHALEKRKILRANISKKLPGGKQAKAQAKAQWKVEKPLLEQGFQWLNTAIEKLNASEEQQLASYSEFIQQSSGKRKDIPGYSETTSLYRAIRKSNKAREKANETFSELKGSINSYEVEISKLRNAEPQNDDAEFGPKLKVYIEACLYTAKRLQGHISYRESVCDFYKSIALNPIKEAIYGIQASISSSRKDIDDYTTIYHNKEREKQTIEQNIQEVLRQALNATGRNIVAEGLEHFDSNTDQWFTQQREQHEQAIQGLTPQPSSAQPESILTVQGIMEQGKVNEQSRNWLQRQEVADYTDKLLEAHRHQYGTEIDADKAVESAKFLADQKFVGETRKYIEITAGLVHKFGVSLDKFYVDTETHQIAIEKSGTRWQQKNLVPLKFNRYGVLMVGNRKLKGSIIASERRDPYTLILSIRSPELAFAPNTVMQQSGNVDFKDLGKLEEGGNMNIAAIAIAREFKEEAPGYKVVPETLQRVESRSTPTEQVAFFKAEAVVDKKAENTIIDDEHFRGTAALRGGCTEDPFSHSRKTLFGHR